MSNKIHCLIKRLYIIERPRNLIRGLLEHIFVDICQNKTAVDITKMEEENALPHGWENMAYDAFLIERRKLMAAKIKQAYDILKSNI